MIRPNHMPTDLISYLIYRNPRHRNTDNLPKVILL